MDNQLKEQMLDMLLGSLTDEAKKFATEEIDKIKQTVNDDLTKMKSDAEKLKTELDKVLEDCPTVVNLGTIEKPKKELTHCCFDKILKVMASAKRKEKNIMLVGGAGGGKTHVVKQIADTLKLPFYPMSVGMQTTKSDLLGFINATGQYMPSCIRLAYENGGVLLLDEFDAAHAGVVTVLNSLLANGHCSFPDKVIDKHKDFHCLVACNTYGQGANLDYIGRNRLDGATLDRFIIIDMNYDSKLEKKLTHDNWWYGIISKIRGNAANCGIKMIISPRACMDGADLLEAGFNPAEALDMVVFKGCADDIKKKLLKGVDLQKAEESKQNDNIPDNTPTDREESKVESGDFDYEIKIFESESKFRIDKRAGKEFYTLRAIGLRGDYSLNFGNYLSSGVDSVHRNVLCLSIADDLGTYVNLDRQNWSATKVLDILHGIDHMDLEGPVEKRSARFKVYDSMDSLEPKETITLNPKGAY